LKAFVGHTAQTEDCDLRLFTAVGITPADTDTAATYTGDEAAGGGYAEKAIAAASWTVSANPITYAAQTWTFTGALTGSATIYGYFMTRSTTGDLMWAEKFASTFQPLANGDNYTINLQLGAD
jgi:hypothetical protein